MIRICFNSINYQDDHFWVAQRHTLKSRMSKVPVYTCGQFIPNGSKEATQLFGAMGDHASLRKKPVHIFPQFLGLSHIYQITYIYILYAYYLTPVYTIYIYIICMHVTPACYLTWTCSFLARTCCGMQRKPSSAGCAHSKKPERTSMFLLGSWRSIKAVPRTNWPRSWWVAIGIRLGQHC